MIVQDSLGGTTSTFTVPAELSGITPTRVGKGCHRAAVGGLTTYLAGDDMARPLVLLT